MNIKAKVLLLLLAICTWAACHFGPKVSSFPPAHTSRGAEADVITISKTHLAAELIEVRDSELVILTEDAKLELLPYTSIQSLKIHGLDGRFEVGSRRVPSPQVRDNLRLVSRFPQGLTPELLKKLLETHGQTELVMRNP